MLSVWCQGSTVVAGPIVVLVFCNLKLPSVTFIVFVNGPRIFLSYVLLQCPGCLHQPHEQFFPCRAFGREAFGYTVSE